MLSVSRCGYDNEYGQKYLSIHSTNDLKILKDNEKFITVSGGEHCGELYWFFIAIPSSIDSEAVEYYNLLKDLFIIDDIDKNI
jgi:hypothetical protein